MQRRKAVKVSPLGLVGAWKPLDGSTPPETLVLLESGSKEPVVTLSQGKELGRGSFGTVFEYQDEQFKMAVKFANKGKKLDDAKVIAKVFPNHCGVLMAKELFPGAVGMESMEGSLADEGALQMITKHMSGSISKKAIATAIHSVYLQVHAQLNCMLETKKLLYTDLKAENVYYMLQHGGTVRFVVGDMGGFDGDYTYPCYYKTTDTFCTFLPNNYLMMQKVPLAQQKQCLNYSLGMLVFELLVIAKSSKLHREQLQTYHSAHERRKQRPLKSGKQCPPPSKSEAKSMKEAEKDLHCEVMQIMGAEVGPWAAELLKIDSACEVHQAPGAVRSNRKVVVAGSRGPY